MFFKLKFDGCLSEQVITIYLNYLYLKKELESVCFLLIKNKHRKKKEKLGQKQKF